MAFINKRWGEADLSGAVPESVVEAIESSGDIVAAVATALSAFKAALELFSLSLTSLDDPTALVVQALVELVDKALAVFEETKASVAYLIPQSYASALSVEASFQALGNSFFDATDDQKPDYPEPVHFLQLTYVITGSDIYEVAKAMEPLLEFFGAPVERTIEPLWKPGDVYPPPTGVGQGMAPDWNSYPMSQLAFIKPLVSFLRNAVDQFAPSPSGSDFLSNSVDLLGRKVASLELSIQDALGVVDQIEKFTKAPSGIFVFATWGSARSVEQAQAIYQAASAPDFPFSRDSICGLVSIHLQTPSPAAYSALVNMWRLSKLGAE